MYAAMNNYARDTYRNVAVDSGVAMADPHGLVSMLLAGAIERASGARAALVTSDHVRAAKLIGAAGAIVAELRACLDHGQGGDIAGLLESIYDYIQRRLLQANRHRDRDALLECMDLLAQLYSAWRDIGKA